MTTLVRLSGPVRGRNGALLIHGVNRKPFVRTFTTSAHVIGFAFRAAGFRPLLGSSVGTNEGKAIPAEEIWGEDDITIHRVGQVAAIAGVSTRTPQRTFTEYVGISPKWVIQRRRLIDAAARAHSGEPVHWAELADTLGVSDQAHLIRAFTASVGMPPAAYSRTTAGR